MHDLYRFFILKILQNLNDEPSTVLICKVSFLSTEDERTEASNSRN